MFKLALVAEIEDASSAGEAQEKLDAFREAVLPELEYGITLYRADVELLRATLSEIRQAGHNTHPAAIWMQKLAAHALEPEKFAHPGPQPAAEDAQLLPDEDTGLVLAITVDGFIAGALPASQYQGHDEPYPGGFGELLAKPVRFDMFDFTCEDHAHALQILARYDPRSYRKEDV